MKNKFSFLKCVRFDSHLQKKKTIRSLDKVFKNKYYGAYSIKYYRAFMCLYVYIALTNIGRWERGTNDQAQPCPAKSLFIVSTKSLIEVQNEQDIVMFSIPRLLLLYDYKKLLL